MFNLITRYLYTDEISLNTRNAIHIMYAAKKYCVDRLTKDCSDFFKNNLNADNACFFLEQAHLCSEDKLAAECRNVINNNSTMCLRSPAFTDLCKECVYSITDDDDLEVTEDVVYEAVMKWSEAECGRQNLEVTDPNRRQLLGDLLYTTRFPVMDSQHFVKEVLKNDVLNAEEFLVIQRFQNDHVLKSVTKFKTSKRKQYIFRIERFSDLGEMWSFDGNSDAISFKASTSVYFHGIGIFGCCTGSAEYMVKLELFDSNEALMSTNIRKIATDQKQKDVYDVTLDTPHKLEADTFYTIVATTQGPHAKYGLNGRTTIQKKDVCITFKNSNKSKIGTDILNGQIPFLLISY